MDPAHLSVKSGDLRPEMGAKRGELAQLRVCWLAGCCGGGGGGDKTGPMEPVIG